MKITIYTCVYSKIWYSVRGVIVSDEIDSKQISASIYKQTLKIYIFYITFLINKSCQKYFSKLRLEKLWCSKRTMRCGFAFCVFEDTFSVDAHIEIRWALDGRIRPMTSSRNTRRLLHDSVRLSRTIALLPVRKESPGIVLKISLTAMTHGSHDWTNRGCRLLTSFLTILSSLDDGAIIHSFEPKYVRNSLVNI